MLMIVVCFKLVEHDIPFSRVDEDTAAAVDDFIVRKMKIVITETSTCTQYFPLQLSMH